MDRKEKMIHIQNPRDPMEDKNPPPQLEPQVIPPQPEGPEQAAAENPPENQPEQVTAEMMLKFYPELQAKLLEAITTGHFMVTVHCQLVRPGQSGDLQHYLFQQGYPPNDIMSSLAHVGTVHVAKNSPAADTKGAKGWV